MEKKKLIAAICAVSLYLFVFVPHAARAADMNFAPSAGSYGVGSTFSVRVLVSSPATAMNGASAVVSFPTDLLSVASVSTAGSLIAVWATQPTFSNAAGTISFEGVALNPGFTGTAGDIVTITFRAKAAGTARLSFSSGSVLANDGAGTDITGKLGTAQFSITPALPHPAASPARIATSTQAATSTVPVSIAPPTIAYYPLSVPAGGAIVVEGSSTPGATVVVSFAHDGASPETYAVSADGNGTFLAADQGGAQAGSYRVSAWVVDGTGQRSLPTATYDVAVISPWYVHIWRWQVPIAALAALFVLVLLLLSALFRRSHRTGKEVMDMLAAERRLASLKLGYFGDYTGSQLDRLAKDHADIAADIENVKGHIADYKRFIDEK